MSRKGKNEVKGDPKKNGSKIEEEGSQAGRGGAED